MWGDGGADVRNQMLSIEIKACRVFTSSHVSRSYPTVFALFHPQRSLQMQLADLLRWRSSHGSHQVEAVVLFEDLRGGKKKMRAWSRLYVEWGVRAGKAIGPHKNDSYLLHLFTAALYSLVRVDTGRNGGELLMVLTLSHLWVHAVDEALYSCHLEEETHRNTLLLVFFS